jgi:hypothetical protein
MSELVPSTDLRKFVESFFSNIGATLSSDSGILIVQSVPKDFESASGKKAPYRLRFDGNGDDSSELITKGSTLLKTITSYLESRGQTTLIKLDFSRDYKKELEHYFSFRNSKIEAFSQKAKYQGFPRFSMTTTLQYLNEKEQITNHICINDGKLIDISLDKYAHAEGKKEEAPSLELKKSYDIAKENLKEIIRKRVENTADNLSKKLERETERIKDHYMKQNKEFEDLMTKYREQKSSVEKQLEKAKESDISTLKVRLDKINDSISQLEKSGAKEKWETELAFFLADEKNKHSLRVNTRLINTSIIYYPVLTFELVLASSRASRKVSVTYDPFRDSITKNLNCDSCSREIHEVFLCSSGHIACSSCLESCGACNSPICLSCMKKMCDFCGKKLCKKCTTRCSACWKTCCINHANKDYTDEKDYCLNCLARCENCSKYVRRNRLKKIKDRDVCGKCFGVLSIN